MTAIQRTPGPSSSRSSPSLNVRVHPLRDAMVAGLLVFTTGLSGIATYYYSSSHSYLQLLREDLLRLAQLAASFVDGDLHRTFTSPDQESSPQYQHQVAHLHSLLHAWDDLKFVYTVVLVGDRVHFVLDSSPPGDADGDGVDDHAYIMEAYDSPDPEMLVALRQGRSLTTRQLYSDKWGTFLSGYAPLYDSAGTQVGVLGVDMSAEAYRANMAFVSTAAMWGGLTTLLISAACGAVVYGLRRRSYNRQLQRRQIEADLHRSERRYRDLFDNNPSMFFTVRSDGVVVSVNHFGAQQLGYHPQELLGQSVLGVVYEPDRGAFLKHLRHCVEHPETVGTWEFRKVRKDGSMLWVRETGRAVSSGDGHMVVFIVCEDITEHKRVANALLESKERYRAIVNAAMDAVVVMDAKGRIRGWNHRAEQIFGWTAQEVLGRDLASTIVPPRYHEQHRRGLAACLQTGTGAYLNRRVETEALRRDGSEFPVELTITQAHTGDHLFFSAFVRDISGRKRAEQALRERDEWLSLAAEISGIGIWTWEVSTDTVRYSQELGPMWGMPRGATHANYAHFLESVYPDDRAAVDRAIRDALERGADYRPEFRIVWPDGTVRWMEARGRVYRNENGTPLRMVGVTMDITERRQADAALHQSVERFDLAVRDSREGLWDASVVTENPFHPDNPIYYSPRFKELLGFREHEFPNVLGSWSRLLHPEDRDRVFEALRAHLEHRVPYDVEYRMFTRQGECRWYAARGQAIWDERGLPVRMAGSFSDVTDRKRTQEALRESEELLRTIIEHAAVGIAHVDCNTRFLRVNPKFSQIVGYTPDELYQMTFSEITYPEDLAPNLDLLRKALQGEITSYSLEKRYLHKQGYPVWANLTASVVRDEQGNPKYFVSVIEDITERKRAADALRRSEERFRQLVEATNDWVWETNEQGVYTYSSPRIKDILGYEPEEVVGRSVFDFMPPEEVARVGEKFAAIARDRRPFTLLANTSLRKDGSEVVLECNGMPILDENGALRGYRGIDRDITERKRLEEELRRSRNFLDFIVENIPLAVFVKDAQDGFKILLWNKTAEHIFGRSREEVLGHDPHAYRPKDQADLHLAYDRQAMQERQIVQIPEEPSESVTRGTMILRTTKVPLYDEQGRPKYLLGICEDITEHKRAEKALRKSEERFRQLVETTNDWVWETNEQGVYTYSSPRVKDILGYEPEEVVGRSVFDFMPPEEVARVGEKFAAIARDRRPFTLLANTSLRKDGSEVVLECNGMPILDENGALRGYRGIDRDITERVRAAEDRERLSEQLKQSQKLEALGRLAGGVAHDFNNLLTVILGHTEMLLPCADECDNGSKGTLASGLKQIQRAAQRAASLTRQLLAFSRKRPTKTEVVDPNRVIADMEKLLQRLIGEHIQLEVNLDPSIPGIVSDTGQVEQVVMNLILNARDAMAERGKITITTGTAWVDQAHAATHPNAKPGPHVTIAVSDTGQGMSEETINRIFEPFFTTKPIGQGTGLGLSTVYGIVVRAGGHIDVDSRIGRGSTFKVFFPAAEASATQPATPAPVVVTTGQLRGQEIVLVCEDDDLVRRIACQTLRSSGYEVLEAENGPRALWIARQHPQPIDLLVTDWVMPEMTGKELAEALTAIQPGLRVLFVSGYTSDVVDLEGIERDGGDFLEKPFRPVVLLEQVRRVLDRRRSASVS